MTESRLFPALLRYWRGRRGLSQLELGLQANVSARHVSFLEAGRARPSEEMVLRLLSVMGVPLGDQNQALVAAGFSARFPELRASDLPPEIDMVVAQMMAQHEPYPLVVLGFDGTVLRTNDGARHLFGAFIAEPSAVPSPAYIFSLIFDRRLLRPHIAEWESFARSVVSRIHREFLQSGDSRLGALLDRLFELDVPREWQHPDFATPPPSTLRMHLVRDPLHASFLVTVTTFLAPQQVAIEELRVESCFPLDAATRELCARLAR